MEIFIFVLAVVALIGAVKNRSDIGKILSELRHLREAIDRTEKVVPPVEPPIPARPPSPPLRITAPRPRIPPRPPTSPLPPSRRLDWEALIGVQLFSWIAGVALVFAAIFFLKYSVEHGWLSPPIRMTIGLLTGAALLVLCEWKAARRYAVTANALDAAGIAILFSTFFAAYALWNLLGAVPTFGLMAMVTAAAVLLSIRHDSTFVALLGLAGGFATPVLLSTGEDRPIALFSYLLLLNAGLNGVAYRKRWPYLTALCVLFTTLYQWGWVVKFLQSGNLSLAPGIFLIFPILSFVALTLGEKKSPSGEDGKENSLFSQTAAISAALPHLFALYLAAVPAYGDRYWLLFGFLFLVDAGLAAIAAKRGPEILHTAAAIVTVLVFGIWFEVSYKSAAWPAILGITAVFVLFYLGVPHIMGRFRLRFADAGAWGVFAAPVLLVVFPILAAIEPAAAAPGALFGALFALMAVLALHAVARHERLRMQARQGAAIKHKEGAIHVLAAFFALAAGAVWSAKHLDSGTLLPALSIYALFGLFYLGVPLTAVPRAPVWSQGLYLALAGHAFLFFVVLQKPLAIPPWPFLGVLALLDLAIGAAALYSRRWELHLGALAASQAILLSWEMTAGSAPWPTVAILCALAVAAFGLAWFRLARRLRIPAAASVVASLSGLVVLAIAPALRGSPDVALLAFGSVLFLGFLLAVDWAAGWHFIAPAAVLPGAWLLVIWQGARFKPENWPQELFFAAAIYAVFLAYPLLMGYRALRLIEPYLAAVIAGVPFFFFARQSLLAGGFAGSIGLLPVTQAALMAGLLWKLLRLEPPGERTLGRLALVAGAVLAFVTVAIPLQLEKQWITIGFALQAAALAWLSRRIPHPGLVAWTSGLLAAVFVRLVFNPAVFSYHPRGAMPIWNWYLYAYLVSAAAFFATAWFLRGRNGRLAASGGTVLLFILVNIEIADFYSKGPTLTFDFDAGLAQDLTTTIGWGIFAFGLLIAGLVLRSKPARVSAIVLLSVTVAKCFLHDLWRLGGLYRIGSLVGLAICLTLVALLLQKFVLQLQPQNEAEKGGR